MTKHPPVTEERIERSALAIAKMILSLGSVGFEGKDILNILERVAVGCIVALSQNEGEEANFEVFCSNVRDHLATVRFHNTPTAGSA